MNRAFAGLFLSVAVAALASTASAQTLLTKNFSADPSPHYFAGQYVVYATDDQNNSGKYWDSTSWRVLTSSNLTSWKDHGPILPANIFKWASADAKAWAPEALRRSTTTVACCSAARAIAASTAAADGTDASAASMASRSAVQLRTVEPAASISTATSVS